MLISFNTSSFPKLFFKLETCTFTVLSATVDPPLDSLRKLTQSYDNDHVHDTDNRPGLKTLERISGDRLTHVGKFRESDNGQDRGIFQCDDELVDDGRIACGRITSRILFA